jgi:hypothetical protein
MLKPETKFWIKSGLNVLEHPAPFGVFVASLIRILFLISITSVLWIPYLFYILVPNIHILFSIVLGVAIGIFLFFFLTVRTAYYFYIKGFQ